MVDGPVHMPNLRLDSHLQLATSCAQVDDKAPYLEDHLPVDGSVFNNHGDRFRPLTFPFQNGLSMANLFGGWFDHHLAIHWEPIHPKIRLPQKIGWFYPRN